MTAKQQSKLTMYKTVIGFCYDNAIIFQLIPAFQTSLTLFQEQVAKITGTLEDESDLIGGIAEKKSELREDLEQKMLALAFSIFAYADAVGDTELKGRVNFTKSDIARLRDDKLVAITANVLGLANQHLANLSAYGVTAATITELTTARELFVTSMPRPRLAVTARSKNGDLMQDQFTLADSILKNQMDKMIGTLSATQPALYIEYNDVRLIIDSPTTTTQIKGTATNKNTNEPLSGVTVTIVETETTAVTNEEGEYLIKPATSGTYTVTFAKNGFTSVTIPNVEVKLGQIKRVDAALSVSKVQ